MVINALRVSFSDFFFQPVRYIPIICHYPPLFFNAG